MSIKKNLLIAVIACALMVFLFTGSASAWLSEWVTAAARSNPQLGGEIVVSALDNEQYQPSVAYNSQHDEYLVVWHNQWAGNKDIYAQRVTGQGELLSGFSVEPTGLYPNDRVDPSVAYDPVNDRYLVVWAYETAVDNWDIHGVFVNWDGLIEEGQDEYNICDAGESQHKPKVAYSKEEEEFMIVWMTVHSASPDDISGRRMKASDGTFPPSPSDFTIDHSTDDRINPEVAYNLERNEYLVVYDDSVDVFGTRFDRTGSPLGVGEFDIASSSTLPSVAACWETDQYLVTWQDGVPDIYAQFIKGFDGSLDGGPLHLENTSVDEVRSQVACNSAGNQFLVVWQQQFSSAEDDQDGIWGQFVNTDKTLGADFAIMSPTGGVTAEFTTPAVAGGNVNYLTVWEHDRAGTAYQDIHGRLITPYAVFLPLMINNP